MIHCKYCNTYIKRKSDFPRHLETARHIAAAATAAAVRPIETNEELSTETKNAPAPAPAPAQEPNPAYTPEISVDAIINLFRFTHEVYMNLPEKGIVKTATELLSSKIAIENPPILYRATDETFVFFYRGNWVLEKMADIEKIGEDEGEDEDENVSEFKMMELIEMFIENMMVQFRRNQQLHDYRVIAREITNGYRQKNKLRIIKKLSQINIKKYVV